MLQFAAPLRITLIGFVALALAMGVGRFAFTPILPMMQQDGLLGIGNGGVLASAHTFGYLIGAVLAARFAVPFKPALVRALFAIGIATLAMGLTDNFVLWLILRLAGGVCSAGVLVLVGNHVIARLNETGRAPMQGWVFAGVGAGIALAGLGTLAIMTFGLGSAPAWQIFGVVSIAACGAMWLSIGADKPGAHLDRRHTIAPPRPLDWGVLVAYGTAGFGYIVPATYLPVMARDAVPAPLIYGWSWVLFGLAAFLSTVVSARLSAAYSNRQVWVASQLAMAAGLLLPALYPHILAVVVAGLSVGGTFMIVTMAGMKEAHRIASGGDVQRHVAALTAAFAAGQILGPIFAGSLFEHFGSFSAPLLVTGLALAGSTAALARPASRKEALR